MKKPLKVISLGEIPWQNRLLNTCCKNFNCLSQDVSEFTFKARWSVWERMCSDDKNDALEGMFGSIKLKNCPN